MTKFQAIIDAVLLGSMGLGGLPGVGRSNHVDSASFFFFKWVYAKYGVHVELVKKRWVYAKYGYYGNYSTRSSILFYFKKDKMRSSLH